MKRLSGLLIMGFLTFMVELVWAQRATVIEGETLLRSRPAARATSGELSAQDMTPFGANWSGNAQLFWAPTKRGDRLELPVNVPVAGNYRLTLYLTQAPDYGLLKLEVNGHSLSSFDGYANQVRRSEALEFDSIPLVEGANSLTLVAAGRSRTSSGILVGFDQMVISPAGTPERLNARPQGRRTTESGNQRRIFTAKPPVNDAIIAKLPQLKTVLPYKTPPMKILKGPDTPVLNVDLRNYIAAHFMDIRDQKNRDTCSVFATTFLIEYGMTKSFGSGFADMSEEFLNAAGNMASGKTDDGDFFYVLDKGYQSYGLCAEIFMPYQSSIASPPNYNQLHLASVWQRLQPDFVKNWDNTRGLTDAEFNKAIAYLDQSLPVAAGMWWPKKNQFTINTIAGVDLMGDPGKANVADGHSIVLVGYAKSNLFPGGGYFVFRNSWGTEFGDQGYGYASFEYVKKYANDLLVYKPALN